MKRCSKCHLEKPASDFHKRKNRPGGHSWCKECVSAGNRAQYERTLESTLARKAAYRKANSERIKFESAKYRDENREQLNQYHKAYAVKYPHKRRSISVAYRAKKLSATPAWANHKYIALFYEMARLESERLGVKVHVDHIVPLQGSSVCGLHCEHNLQLLTASANLTKSNRVWPDMPC